MKKARWYSSFDSLFNMYREDTSTLTHSLNLKDPHMQMRYIWGRMIVKRVPQLDRTGTTCMIYFLFLSEKDHTRFENVKFDIWILWKKLNLIFELFMSTWTCVCHNKQKHICDIWPCTNLCNIIRKNTTKYHKSCCLIRSFLFRHLQIFEWRAQK